MNLDRLLHDTKTFGELLDSDVEKFLRERQFRREHLNIEFKVAFPTKSGGRYDIREICRYIAGFSNEEGGLIAFGVADSIKTQTVAFEDYVPGLTQHPSIEDLSSWVTDRVAPLVQSPAIRSFVVDGRTVILLKIPEGVNRPYAYVEPNSNALTFFKKTAGGIKELRPDEVKDLYWSAIIDQSTRILKAGALKGFDVDTSVDDFLTRHRTRTIPLLEDVENYGHVGVYCTPLQDVSITADALKAFMESNLFKFSEATRYAPRVDVFQSGVSSGYFPRAIRQDIKSTSRVTLYTNGASAFDSQIDSTMDHDNRLNPYWLAYEVQRQLQLAKAMLKNSGAQTIRVTVELDHIEDFAMKVEDRVSFHRFDGKYAGAHEPIVLEVSLDDINDYDGKSRNIAFAAVKTIVDEASRIFGYPSTPHGVWDENSYLGYVKGLENQR